MYFEIRLLRYGQHFTITNLIRTQVGLRQKLNKIVLFQGLYRHLISFLFYLVGALLDIIISSCSNISIRHFLYTEASDKHFQLGDSFKN